MAKQARRNLTDRGLKALKPAEPGKRYTIMDGDARGLGVRVTDRGHRSFVFGARFPGSKNHTFREIAPVEAKTLTDARETARSWRALVQQGIDPAIVKQQERTENLRKQENTFAAVFDQWFADKVKTERKGLGVKREFRIFIRLWGDRPVTAITEGEVRAFIRAKKVTAPSMARNLLGHLKRFFTWIVDEGCYGLQTSPCDRLKPAKIIGEKAHGRRILSDPELFALWRNAKRLKYPHGAVYQILVLTALRLNEGADARKSELDLQNRIWIVPAARMKGKEGKARDHAVPLIDDAIVVFKSLPSLSGPYLFSATFGKTPAWMTHTVKKRLDRRMLHTLRALARRRGEDPRAVELPRWVNHDIRRTVRSHLSRLKVAEEAREAVLAHVRPGIKATYDHYDYLDEKREALELWAAKLRSIVEPPPTNVIRLARAG